MDRELIEGVAGKCGWYPAHAYDNDGMYTGYYVDSVAMACRHTITPAGLVAMLDHVRERNDSNLRREIVGAVHSYVWRLNKADLAIAVAHAIVQMEDTK